MVARLVPSWPEVALLEGVAEALLPDTVAGWFGQSVKSRAIALAPSGTGRGWRRGRGPGAGRWRRRRRRTGPAAPWWRPGEAAPVRYGGREGPEGILPPAGGLPQGVSCPFSRNLVHWGLLAQRDLEYRAQAGLGGSGGRTVAGAGPCCAPGSLHARAGRPPGSLLEPGRPWRGGAQSAT
jgi:hypothetical protein